ncbi:MAG: hypothetical protein KDD69_16440, partial [Bdellovibrionales bacterium]|nr:hypothetical protein [Bdellovibrionales bacterium]
PVESGEQTPKVLVFQGDRFEKSYQFESPEHRFAVGGQRGQVVIPGAPSHETQMLVTFNGQRLELSTGVSEFRVVVNGTASTGVTMLSDRDEITVGPFQIVVSDPSTRAPVQAKVARAGAGTSPEYGGAHAYDRPHAPEHLRRQDLETEEWESEAARRRSLEGKRFVFGTEPGQDEVTSTIAVRSAKFAGGAGYEMSTSQRFNRAVAEADAAGGSQVSESVLIVFGVFVFCLIVGFLAYFFLVMS